MRLYDNPFSPFARKVRLVLEYKELPFESLDALHPDVRRELAARNPRLEVPVLEDGELVVVNSADIVAYLEHRYPQRPVHPADPARRVAARAWERRSDTQVDAITVDVSLWTWANRPDSPPPGLMEAARRDLGVVYAELESALRDRDFIVGELSIADFALFPHLASVRFLGVGFERDAHPALSAWLERMRALPICQADLARLRDWLPRRAQHGLEMDKIAWRGDRLEWILARGYHDWLVNEIRNDRVIWPV